MSPNDTGLRYRWQRREPDGISPAAAAGAPDRAGTAAPAAKSTPATPTPAADIEPLVARILAARGLSDPADLERFVNASLRHLHDAARLPNIAAAVERIITSLKRGGPIVIYGDYDVDGITASSILYHMFRAAAPEATVRIYIPHRVDEGYGLNPEALRQMHAEGADLVISVDCGITAHEPAKVARELGLDLIITDHHNPPQPGDPLPDAFAIVHPRLPGSTYPFGELCGAGVAFKVAWEFARTWCGSDRVSTSFRDLLTESLAFAALGTIADIVPLRDENRVIARYGLRMMKHTRFGGLNALITAAGLDDERIDSEAVGFRLGPRLNAAGRMGHAREAALMLTEAPPAEADRIARHLNRQNEERRQTERTIFEQACAMAEAAGMTGPDRRVIVLHHPDWHVGVIGIVASNLVERFGRPTVLLHETPEGTLKGSARSIPGYSIHAGLAAASAWLERFGGHDMAAGLAVERAKVDGFVDALTAHANAHISVADLTPALDIDCEAHLGELTPAAVRQVLALGPFGAANPRPALLIRGLRIVDDVRTMGTGGKHLALSVMPADAAATADRAETSFAASPAAHPPHATHGRHFASASATEFDSGSGSSGAERATATVARAASPRGIGWRPGRAAAGAPRPRPASTPTRPTPPQQTASPPHASAAMASAPFAAPPPPPPIATPSILRLVGWSLGDHAPRLRRGMTIDAVIQPKFNTFRGETKVEAELLDLQIHTP